MMIAGWAGLRLMLNVILQAKGGFGFDGRRGWIVRDAMVGAIRGRRLWPQDLRSQLGPS